MHKTTSTTSLRTQKISVSFSLHGVLTRGEAIGDVHAYSNASKRMSCMVISFLTDIRSPSSVSCAKQAGILFINPGSSVEGFIQRPEVDSTIFDMLLIQARGGRFSRFLLAITRCFRGIVTPPLRISRKLAYSQSAIVRRSSYWPQTNCLRVSQTTATSNKTGRNELKVMNIMLPQLSQADTEVEGRSM